MSKRRSRLAAPLRWLAPALLLLAAACAQPGPPADMVVVLPDADGTVGAVTIANQKGTRVLDRPNVAADLTGTPQSDLVALKPEEIQSIFGSALAAEPLKPVAFLLNFTFGTDELTDESKAALPSILETVRNRPAPDIAIIGHTDRAGAADYNYRLSLKRAERVRDLLVEVGADPALIAVSSHGENNPVVPTADGVAEPKNRRVEVSIR